MSLNYTEARDETLDLFKTAWDAGSGGTTLYYWDVTHEPPADQDWARVTMRHTVGQNAAIGSKCFIRQGVVTVQIFTKYGEGLSRSDVLSKVAADAFQGKCTPGGVWFRNVRLNEVGQDGDFFQVNVIADFEYYEVI